MSLPGHDPLLRAIVDRICAIVGRLPGDLEALARVLGIPEDDLRGLDEPQHQPSATVVIDLVAALVREFAVDPHWLLSGQYDATVHRRALVLGEDRTNDGARAIQQFVREQYQRLRDGPHYLTLPNPSTDQHDRRCREFLRKGHALAGHLDGDNVPTIDYLRTKPVSELGTLVDLAKPLARQVMAIREFTDDRGRQRPVRAVFPKTLPRVRIGTELAEGWLAFEARDGESTMRLNAIMHVA